MGGHPSDATIVYSVVTNEIKNSPITQRDVKVAIDMLGKSTFGVQGKRVQHQPDAVDVEILEVPPTILDYYKEVEISVDVMHVNRIPFLVIVSKDINYGTAQALESMKIPKMEMVIKSIISSYKVRGFHVAILHVDIQFKANRDRKLLGDVTTNMGS